MKPKYSILFLTVLLLGCDSKTRTIEEVGTYESVRNPDGLIGIAREREPADYSWVFSGKKHFPKYDPASSQMWQVDVRSANLSRFELTDRYSDVINASFDTKTVWPEKLPTGFSPDEILEQGKDPGLNVRALHAQGITGKGVGLAIIDQGLLTGHDEYKDQLRFYEEIHCAQETSMHGAAVASIAVGRTVGVAPEADLYFIAETHGAFTSSGFEVDFSYIAASIDRIIEVNRELPEGSKIRAISISLGLGGNAKNSHLVRKSIERASDQNIFVISVESAGLGIGRKYSSDANEYSNLRPGIFWGKYFENSPNSDSYRNGVKYPMDYRTTASPTGVSDFVFYTEGGMSWAVPYMAGLYVLCCQVDPSITPSRFQKTARETSTAVEYRKDGVLFKLEQVVDPVRLINKLRNET